MLAVPDRTEREILLLCARNSLEPRRVARLGWLLRQNPDWDVVLAWAQRHRVQPLLCRNLRSHLPEAVPGSVLERLSGRLRANARRNLLLTGELLQLLDLFRAHGISAVPYKGPALAASLYDNLALRQFDDLDVLVRERDRRRAMELLGSRGYQADLGLPLRGYRHNVKWVHAERRLRLELHWRISFFFPLDPERLWQRLDAVTVAGRPVPHFDPEDLLLILCVHGAKHLWQRLQWICDLAELCRIHRELDWPRLLDRAGRIGGRRMVALGLLLAHEVLGAELPENVLAGVRRDRAVGALAADVRSWLFRRRRVEGTLEQSLFYLKMRERPRDKARYALHLARARLRPTARDRAWLPLPPALSCLYYGLRPIRLAVQHGPMLLRSLLRPDLPLGSVASRATAPQPTRAPAGIGILRNRVVRLEIASRDDKYEEPESTDPVPCRRHRGPAPARIDRPRSAGWCSRGGARRDPLDLE